MAGGGEGKSAWEGSVKTSLVSEQPGPKLSYPSLLIALPPTCSSGSSFPWFLSLQTHSVSALVPFYQPSQEDIPLSAVLPNTLYYLGSFCLLHGIVGNMLALYLIFFLLLVIPAILSTMAFTWLAPNLFHK